MTQDGLRAQVRQELAEHLDALDANAPAYIDAYIDGLLHGRNWTPNRSTMHPFASRLVRELVMDAMSAARGNIVVSA